MCTETPLVCVYTYIISFNWAAKQNDNEKSGTPDKKRTVYLQM